MIVSNEVELGRIVGPFMAPPFVNLRLSPLGVVLEKETGKFCLIHHLSYPKSESMNDGISREEVSVSYFSFDRAVDLVWKAGPGALLAKSDIDSPFSQIVFIFCVAWWIGSITKTCVCP